MFGRCSYTEKGSQVQARFITTLKKSVTEQNELRHRARTGSEQYMVWTGLSESCLYSRALTVLGHGWLPTASTCDTLPRASSGISACVQDRQEVLRRVMPPGWAPELVKEELEVR